MATAIVVEYQRAASETKYDIQSETALSLLVLASSGFIQVTIASSATQRSRE